MTDLEILDLSTIDYPGIPATVIFTHGCNLRCPYCYNHNLLEPIPFDISKELMNRMVQNLKFAEGVVITGGEPLIHPNILDLIYVLKDLGYKIKLDTNGTIPQELSRVVSEVDYIAMDVKSDTDGYFEIGVDSYPISQSINMIKSYAKDYEFRTTCFHPFITRYNAYKIGRWIGTPTKVKRYAIQAGINKDILSKYPYSVCDEEEIQEIKNLMLEYADEVIIRNV